MADDTRTPKDGGSKAADKAVRNSGEDLSKAPAPAETDAPVVDTKAREEQAQSELLDTEIGGQTIGLTVQEQTQVNTVRSAGTVEDPAGVERIVVPTVETSWRPSQVEPDPAEVARLERLQGALDAKKTERLDALKV